MLLVRDQYLLLMQCIVQLAKQQATGVFALSAGRPLPPLKDWLPGELDHASTDLVEKLTS